MKPSFDPGRLRRLKTWLGITIICIGLWLMLSQWWQSFF